MMKVVQKEVQYDADMATQELMERKPLPIGRTQFMEWSDRIIKAAAVEADVESQRYSLAAMLQMLAPTEAFREDAYFALQLRNAAVKQTAYMIGLEIKDAQEEKKKLAEATATQKEVVDDGRVLADKGV